MKDTWGIPVLRFHWKWSDHELNQVRHMQQTFRAILEGMGGQIAAGGRGGGGAAQRRDHPAQTGQRAGGQAPQTGQAGPQTGQANAPAGQPTTMAAAARRPMAASADLARRRDHPRGRHGAHGRRPATSPLNKYCQAHEVKNLFVADAAPFVSNADKNPTHTIVALAWRTAEYLAEEMRKGNV